MTAILAFLTANKKDVAYALAFLALIWAGWYMRGIYDDHLKLAELQAAQQRAVAAEKTINQQATEYEHSRAASQASLATLKQQLRAAHAQNPDRDNCLVGPDLVRILNQ